MSYSIAKPGICDTNSPYFSIFFQDRSESIVEELRALDTRLDELRTAANRARDVSDLSLLHPLSQQIELLSAKQTALIQEQQEHAKYIRAR